MLRKRPDVLGWLAVRHVDAEVAVLREAIAAARADLGVTGASLAQPLTGVAVAEVLAALEDEVVMLVADARAVRLVAHAVAVAAVTR